MACSPPSTSTPRARWPAAARRRSCSRFELILRIQVRPPGRRLDAAVAVEEHLAGREAAGLAHVLAAAEVDGHPPALTRLAVAGGERGGELLRLLRQAVQPPGIAHHDV